ncbi:LysR family transcriptional regulator [Acidovorax carolinensis]|uniref:LysR family transcriptional regulator n=1 Tax=Acidovorax carolinensis TaxID=553814 RepID=UPI000B342757|nr:LysR family transcriptional regulator [Acidovorax carolinensis]ART49515.1 LysR family transcriptional regulator [Acidovorax carolinensis]
MNLRHLEHLLAIADTGSFSRAAGRLFITQSALSRSIQGLEAELGGPVLDRLGKRNTLTPLGLEVVARARPILRDLEALRDSARLLQQGDLGRISVGLGSGPAALLTVPLLTTVARDYPGVRVSVTHGPAELLVMQLRNRQCDALVVDLRRVVPAPDLQIEALAEQRAGFIVRSGHPLAGATRVTLAQVLAYPVACTPLSDEVIRLMVDQFGVQAHPSDMVRLECDDVSSLLAAVEQSDTVFLGVQAAARAGLDSGRLTLLPMHPDMRARARYAVITLAGRTTAPAMASFRQILKTHLYDDALPPDPG